MKKALITRGVYVRGKPYAEGAVVEVSDQEFAELKTANYAVAAPKEKIEPPKNTAADDTTSANDRSPADPQPAEWPLQPPPSGRRYRG